MHKPKIAVVLSHPIQHFCPQYASWAQWDTWNLKVFFASKSGLEAYEDPDFGETIVWEGLALDFPHTFLNDGKVIPIDSSLDAPKLDEELVAFDPDVVIVYGYIQKLQRRALNWGYSEGKKVLMLSDSEDRQKRPWYKRAAKGLLLPSAIYSKVDGFLTVGDANERYHQKYGAEPHQMFRLSYPIDRDYYDSFHKNIEDHREELRSRLGISDGGIICTMVAKLAEWKRQKDIIASLAHLKDVSNEVTALIIGTGKQEKQLKAMASALSRHKAVFTGFVQPSELPKYYAATDIYIHASSREPHSVAVSEAIYMGRPVILSDRCGSIGPNDDLQVGRNGFVYPCGNAKELANRIRVLVQHPKLRRKFSEASRAFAVQAQEKSHGKGLESALTALRLLVE